MKKCFIVFLILWMAAAPVCLSVFAEFSPQTVNAVILLTNNTAVTEGTGVTISGGCVEITEGGIYSFSGCLEDGQLIVSAGSKDDVILLLNGVIIENVNGTVFTAEKTGSLTIILNEKTENLFLTTGSTALSESGDGDEDQTEDAVFTFSAKCKVDIKGDGSLQIENENGNGIRVTKDLTVIQGAISVRSSGIGIKVKDDFLISGGTVCVKSGRDGIRTGSEEKAKEDGSVKAANGGFRMEGGMLSVTSGEDGIQSETDIRIEDGTIQILSGEGHEAASDSHTDSIFTGRRGYFNLPQSSDTLGQEEISCKGIKAAGIIEICGGIMNIDCCDDCIHSNNALLISGGSSVLQSGDDGLHADDSLMISGGSINIISSYEGIEAFSITVSGGDIRVNSTDDGFNACGGEDMFSAFGADFGGGFRGRSWKPEQSGAKAPEDINSGHGQDRGDIPIPPSDMPLGPESIPEDQTQAPPFFGDPFSHPDEGGTVPIPEDDNTGSNDIILPSLVFTGGTVYVNANGDGLDSNGDLTVSGGYIIVDGPASSMNGALDSGSENSGSITVSGGTVLAIGASGMAECFSVGSLQASVSADISFHSGDTIRITAADGIVLIKHIAAKSGQSIVFSCPELQEGDQCIISVGDKSVSVDAALNNSIRPGRGRRM